MPYMSRWGSWILALAVVIALGTVVFRHKPSRMTEIMRGITPDNSYQTQMQTTGKPPVTSVWGNYADARIDMQLKAADETLDKCVHTMNLMIDRINADHPEVKIPHLEEDHVKQQQLGKDLKFPVYPDSDGREAGHAKRK